MKNIRIAGIFSVHISFIWLQLLSIVILNFIARQHTDARYWYSKSVCPSVCPLRSGIRWKRLNISSQFFSPCGSSIILVLPASNKHFHKILTGSPLRGAKYRWGFKKIAIFYQFSIANDTKYRHSYYGRRIGNRTQAFEWHQLQWLWVTSNPDFKVTILFNVK